MREPAERSMTTEKEKAIAGFCMQDVIRQVIAEYAASEGARKIADLEGRLLIETKLREAVQADAVVEGPKECARLRDRILEEAKRREAAEARCAELRDWLLAGAALFDRTEF